MPLRRRAARALALLAVTPLLGACASSTNPEPPPPLAMTLADSLNVGCAHGVAVGPGAFAYVTSICGTTVVRTNYLTAASAGQGQVGSSPAHTAVSRDGSLVFTANQGSSSVSILDHALGSTLATIPLGGADAFNLLPSRDGRRLFVTTNVTRMYVIDIPTRRIVDSATVGWASNGLAEHPRQPTLYVGSIGDGAVVAIDTRTMRESRRYELGGRVQRIAVSPDGRTLYASNEDEGFQVVSLASGDVQAVDVGPGAIGMAMRPWGDYAYVALANRGRVVAIDLATRTIHGTLNLGGDPRNVAIARDGTVLVASQSGRVHVIRAPE